MSTGFLTAEWRHLAMLNYAVDPRGLEPHVPRGTELDNWAGTTFVSLVGFRFLNTKVKGWPIPLHRDFEEINLRFYVRRRAAEGWRRGVVFIRVTSSAPGEGGGQNGNRDQLSLDYLAITSDVSAVYLAYVSGSCTSISPIR